MHRDNIQPCMVRALSRNVIREDSRFDTSLMSYSRSTTYCFLFNFYHYPCLELSQLLHTLSCSSRMKIEEVFDVLKSQSSKSSNTISIFFGSYINLTTHEVPPEKNSPPPPPHPRYKPELTTVPTVPTVVPRVLSASTSPINHR